MFWHRLNICVVRIHVGEISFHFAYQLILDAPDGHFVFVSFASAFLIKMLRKDYVTLLDASQRVRIIETVEKLVNTLSSPRVAVDERHTPMLYARFLAGLLSKYKTDDNMEMHDAPSVASEVSHPDSLNLPTPPMDHQSSPGSGSNSKPRVSRHRPSPSIEISPPPPEPNQSQFMPPQMPPPHDVFSSTALQNVSPPPQQLRNGQVQPALGSLMAPINLSSTESSAASTVHAASTIHGGSQFAPDHEMTDDLILAPMMAVNNPAFWSHMMLPGFSWAPETLPWEIDTEEFLHQSINDPSAEHFP